MRRTFLAAALLSMLGSAASANNFACPPGQVLYLGMGGSGMVYVDAGFGLIGICSVSASLGNVNVDACRSWYATLLTLRSTGKRVILYFNPQTTENADLQSSVCTPANFGPWNFRPPYHLEPQA